MAVQELNRLDSIKEKAISDLVVERSNLQERLSKSKLRETELQQELSLLDEVLLQASATPTSTPAAPAFAVTTPARSTSQFSKSKNKANTSSSTSSSRTGNIYDASYNYNYNNIRASASSSAAPTAAASQSFATVASDDFSYTVADTSESSPSPTRPFSEMTSNSGVNSVNGVSLVQSNMSNSNTAVSEVVPEVSLEHMGELQLDQQIQMLSKFLVHDKTSLRFQQMRAKKSNST